MNRRLSQGLTYIRLVLLFTIIGALVLYIGGMPVFSYIQGNAYKLIYDGAPIDLKNKSIDMAVPNPDQVIVPEQSEGRTDYQKGRVGMIECERIELAAPLFDNDSEGDLLNGAGHYSGSGLPGEGRTILISGHDTTFFAPLEFMQEGDVVDITTGDKEFRYKVVMMMVAESTDASVYDLSRTQEQLILYTCYPFGQLLGQRTQRYFVYCDPIPMADTTEKE